MRLTWFAKYWSQDDVRSKILVNFKPIFCFFVVNEGFFLGNFIRYCAFICLCFVRFQIPDHGNFGAITFLLHLHTRPCKFVDRVEEKVANLNARLRLSWSVFQPKLCIRHVNVGLSLLMRVHEGTLRAIPEFQFGSLFFGALRCRFLCRFFCHSRPLHDNSHNMVWQSDCFEYCARTELKQAKAKASSMSHTTHIW